MKKTRIFKSSVAVVVSSALLVSGVQNVQANTDTKNQKSSDASSIQLETRTVKKNGKVAVRKTKRNGKPRLTFTSTTGTTKVLVRHSRGKNRTYTLKLKNKKRVLGLRKQAVSVRITNKNYATRNIKILNRKISKTYSLKRKILVKPAVNRPEVNEPSDEYERDDSQSGSSPFDPNETEADIAEEMLQQVNRVRSVGTTCGDTYYPATTPLELDNKLIQAAVNHSKHQAENHYLGHYSPSGVGLFERLLAVGFMPINGTGENVAAGQSGVAQAFTWWLISSGHCANIMNPKYEVFGGGIAYNPKDFWGTRFTQVFAGKDPGTHNCRIENEKDGNIWCYPK